MSRQIEGSLFKIDEYGNIYNPKGKKVKANNGMVNIVIYGKKTRRSILALMIEVFNLDSDTIQLEVGNDWSYNNLVSLNALRESYIEYDKYLEGC